ATDLGRALAGVSVLSPAQVAALSPQAAAQLRAQRQSAALLEALTHEALANSSSRFAAIQQLIDAIARAGDQKAILDLQARIAAEVGMLQNEQTKLQALYQSAEAQQWANAQRLGELTLAGVLGGALHLWLYNSLIVDTFYRAPTQLAAALVGTPDPVSTVDSIWDRGGAVAGYLWSGHGFSSGVIGYYLAGAIVWTLIGLLCVYTMFLIALSSITLAVLLALGPLFMTLLLFEGTRRFFEAWLAQLANYALITILTVLTAALLLQVVESFAAQTAARGNAITTVDALHT